MSGSNVKPDNVPEWMAREMIAVGVIPSDELDEVGKVFRLGSRTVRIVGHASKEAFLIAVEKAGLSVSAFGPCPMPHYLVVEELPQ